MTTATDTPAAASAPGAIYYIGRVVIRALYRAVYGGRVSGRDQLPAEGPVLLTSNHLSGWDTVLIPVSSPRPVQFLTKSAFFTKPGFGGRLQRRFFEAIGAVPVHRTAGRDAQAALEAGSGILRAGRVFAVFPEGTRSRDGRLYQGRSGAAWMALDTAATVVPVGLIGTNRMTPFGWIIGRPRPEVRFGSPVDLVDLAALPAGRARRDATERIMVAIAALSGQERVGEVNASSSDLAKP